MVSEKRCTKCGETKTLGEFSKNARSKDGRRPDCKVCTRSGARVYYAQNVDRYRTYYQDNKAACIERTRARQARNPDYSREWARANPDRMRELSARGSAKRRAILRNSLTEPYSRRDVFAAYGGTCAYCDAPAEHIDHVVAISRGGADAAHNLLPACAPCNLSKSAKSLAEWAATF